MDRLNPCRVGGALAITVAVFYSLCAAAVFLLPDGTFGFFNAWMHGLDLTMLRSDQAMAPGRLVYGLVGTTLTGFVSGVVYVWSYNLAGKLGCCRQ